MNGTNNSTGGLSGITRLMARPQGRAAILAVALVAELLLVAWIGNRTWTGLALLQEEFSAMKTESYYPSGGVSPASVSTSEPSSIRTRP